MIGNLRELPITERIQLVDDIWDSIADEQDALSLSDAQREELDRRLDGYEVDRLRGRKASDALADIRKRF
jgi:putative addiction module component (TIGR02574 family)